MRVYPDHPPFKELKDERIKIKLRKEWHSRTQVIKSPKDMVASQVSRLIVISDANKYAGCIWKVQMPDRLISRLVTDGIPAKMSISSAYELLAIVSRKNCLYLDVYRLTDFIRTKSVPSASRGRSSIECG